MRELDCKEGRGPKNWCFRTVMLEKTFESLLDSKEIRPINPNGNQLWILIGRTDTEAPILWPLDAKGQLIGKDLNAGKNWGQKEKRVTEDEVVGWHHRFNGHELGQTPQDGEGQGGLVCCSLRRVWHDLVTEQQQMARVTTQVTLSQLNCLRILKLWWDGAQKP